MAKANPNSITSLNVTFCNTTTCTIDCNTPFACQHMLIDASKSTTFNLICSAQESCAYLQLIQGPSSSAYINCSDTKSCEYASFNATSTKDVVYVICSNELRWTYIQQCKGVVLYAPNTDDIHVKCETNEACANSIFYIRFAGKATFGFAEYKSAINSTIIANNIKTMLNISCSRSACKYLTVYANASALRSNYDDSTALQLYCNEEHACFESQVFCPSAICNIHCYDSWSCQYANVFIPNPSYTLGLLCVESHPYFMSCTDINIKCLNENISLSSTSLKYADSDLHVVQCSDDTCCPSLCILSQMNNTEYCVHNNSITNNTLECCADLDNIDHESNGLYSSSTTDYVSTDEILLSSTTINNTEDIYNYSNKTESLSSALYIIVIIAIVCSVCLVFICGVLCWKKRTNLKHKKIENKPSDPEAQTLKRRKNAEEEEKEDSSDSMESMYDNPRKSPLTKTAKDGEVVGAFVVDTDHIKLPHYKAIKQHLNEWDTDHVLHWILSLENGRYQKYEQTLYRELHKQQVNGTNLQYLDVKDLRDFGVCLLSERVQLLKHIQNFINSEMSPPQIEGQH